jgi:hypothetical protein
MAWLDVASRQASPRRGCSRRKHRAARCCSDAADDASRSGNPFFGVAPFNLTHAMTELLTLAMTRPR